MSTATARKKLHLNTVSVNLGCSCSRPKLSLLFHPKPKLKTHQKPHKRHELNSTNSSASSSWTNDFDDAATTTTTTTTATATPTMTTPFSQDDEVRKYADTQKRKKSSKKTTTARGFGRVGGEGVAVEKDSDDPYLDFRHSMLQMILENKIYSKDDLRELLNCFLQLNSPSHHGIIVRAFTEIWEGVFSVRSTAGSTKLLHQHYGYHVNKSRDYY